MVVTEIDADLDEYEVDEEATKSMRVSIAAKRTSWLSEDAQEIAERYRSGELSDLDLIRQYGVIVDWGTGELFPKTTRQFRELLRKRSVEYWKAPA